MSGPRFTLHSLLADICTYILEASMGALPPNTDDGTKVVSTDIRLYPRRRRRHLQKRDPQIHPRLFVVWSLKSCFDVSKFSKPLGFTYPVGWRLTWNLGRFLWLRDGWDNSLECSILTLITWLLGWSIVQADDAIIFSWLCVTRRQISPQKIIFYNCSFSQGNLFVLPWKWIGI